MSNKIAMYEGYGYKRRKTRRSKRRGGSWRAKFKAAAKACKGTGRGFKACMRRKLKR